MGVEGATGVPECRRGCDGNLVTATRQELDHGRPGHHVVETRCTLVSSLTPWRVRQMRPATPGQCWNDIRRDRPAYHSASPGLPQTQRDARVFVSRTSVEATNDVAAIVQRALDLTFGPYDLQRTRRLCRITDNVHSSGSTVAELGENRLMIDDRIVTVPHAAAVWVVGTK